MANNITTYLENKLLAQSVGVTQTWHTSTTIGLFITTPTVDYTSAVPTGVEVGSSTYGYTRKTVYNTSSLGSPYWTTNTSGQVSNSGDITWTASGPWNAGNSGGNPTAIGYVGIFSGNNLLWFGSLSAKVLMSVSGDTFTIPSGSLVLTLT